MRYIISEKIEELYAFIFSISFIMAAYSSGISGFSIANLIFTIFAGIGIFTGIFFKSSKNRVKKKENIFFIFFVSICCLTLLSLWNIPQNEYSFKSMVFSISKLAIWAIVLSISNRYLFNYSLITKWLYRITVFATCYLVIQYIMWFAFSIYLPNVFDLKIIRPYSEDYTNYSGYIQYYQNMYRPASFYAESSHYGIVTLCTLATILLKQKYNLNRKEWRMSLFFSLGIILSTSTSAIYLLIILWLYYLLKISKKYRVLIVLSIISVSFIMIFIANPNSVKKIEIQGLGTFGQTIEYTLNKVFTMSESTRVGESFEYISQIPKDRLLLGIGVGNVEAYFNTGFIYLNSIAELIIWCGYIGIISFSVFMGYLLIRYRSLLSNFLLVCYIIKAFSSGIVFNIFGILLLSIAIYSIKETE